MKCPTQPDIRMKSLRLGIPGSFKGEVWKWELPTAAAWGTVNTGPPFPSALCFLMVPHWICWQVFPQSCVNQQADPLQLVLGQREAQGQGNVFLDQLWHITLVLLVWLREGYPSHLNEKSWKDQRTMNDFCSEMATEEWLSWLLP